VGGQRIRKGSVDARSAIKRGPARPLVQRLCSVVLLDEVNVRMQVELDG